jgi:hypothetical protein
VNATSRGLWIAMCTRPVNLWTEREIGLQAVDNTAYIPCRALNPRCG